MVIQKKGELQLTSSVEAIMQVPRESWVPSQSPVWMLSVFLMLALPRHLALDTSRRVEMSEAGVS